MDKERDDIFSKVVRAGKRTYFFDVKSTRGNDIYLTLTESKKSFQDGSETFKKHKIFLYKEDFDKFEEGLKEALEIAREKLALSANDGEELTDKLKSVSFEEL